MLTFVSACSEENLTNGNIDSELLPYFEKFQEEANLRGYDFDVSAGTISGVMTNIKGQNIIAQCTHNKKAPSTVTIDYVYWE